MGGFTLRTMYFADRRTSHRQSSPVGYLPHLLERPGDPRCDLRAAQGTSAVSLVSRRVHMTRTPSAFTVVTTSALPYRRLLRRHQLQISTGTLKMKYFDVAAQVPLGAHNVGVQYSQRDNGAAWAWTPPVGYTAPTAAQLVSRWSIGGGKHVSLVYDYVLEAYAVLRVLLFDEERNGRQAQHPGHRPDPSLLIEATDRERALRRLFAHCSRTMSVQRKYV